MVRFIHLRLSALSSDPAVGVSLELVPLRADVELPAFETGAQIDLHLPGDTASRILTGTLSNDPAERHRYCVILAWQGSPTESAGWLGDQLRIGQTLRVGAPRPALAREGGIVATERGYTVKLRRSDRELPIRPGQTILEALLADGMLLAHSCRAGTCGTCMVTVLAGEPDHQDRILSEAERAANDRMTICCSGSRTPVLELDL